MFYPIVFTFALWLPLTNTILEDDILYDIKWQPELPEIDSGIDHIFTSKRKEKYLCSLPTPQTVVNSVSDSIALTDVEALLETLHSKKLCSYRMDTYWTYELCHGVHVRQYHDVKVAGKKSIVQEYYLGYYNPQNQDIITDANGQQVMKIHHKMIDSRNMSTLAVRYTDGTQCEINSNQPREILVHYVCEERGNDGILNFEEISSCYYEMIVVSRWLCKVPAFSPLEPNRQSINCYPKENARQKPRNLKLLDDERQRNAKKGGRAQFTMTGADGTTFIISYQYADKDDEEAIADAITRELTNNKPVNPNARLEGQSEEQQIEQNQDSTTPKPPSGVLGDDVDREFLDGFLSGRECLPGGTGWWRYEICYGKHVIQYHEEGQHRTSVLLGTWNREKHIEWINANPKKRPTSNLKDRQFVSLYYTDGDVCEMTKKRRVVEVKLRCSKKSDKSHATSMYLVEPEMCSYVMGIESPLFCNLIDYIDEYGIPNREKFFKHSQEQQPEQ